jgi:hypothetical protein
MIDDRLNAPRTGRPIDNMQFHDDSLRRDSSGKTMAAVEKMRL